MDMMRIYANIDINENGCWIWQRSVNSAGYGQLMEDGKYWLAHRYSYTAMLGPILDNLIIRHGSMCSTRCCNPQHLSIGTPEDNYYDSEEKHKQATLTVSDSVNIGGVVYYSKKEANRVTKISESSLSKFTENGIFNIDAYREGCRIANVVPRV